MSRGSSYPWYRYLFKHCQFSRQYYLQIIVRLKYHSFISSSSVIRSCLLIFISSNIMMMLVLCRSPIQLHVLSFMLLRALTISIYTSRSLLHAASCSIRPGLSFILLRVLTISFYTSRSLLHAAWCSHDLVLYVPVSPSCCFVFSRYRSIRPGLSSKLLHVLTI